MRRSVLVLRDNRRDTRGPFETNKQTREKANRLDILTSKARTHANVSTEYLARLVTSRYVKHSSMTSKSTSKMNYVPLRGKRSSPLPSIDSETSDSYQSQPQCNTSVCAMAPVTNNVEKKLSALTLRLEEEFDSEATMGEYYGQCHKCGQPVVGSSEACQAMGNLYHNRCFKCVLCDRMLRDKAFYCIHEQVYCEEDYWVRQSRQSSLSSRRFPVLVHEFSTDHGEMLRLRPSYHRSSRSKEKTYPPSICSSDPSGSG